MHLKWFQTTVRVQRTTADFSDMEVIYNHPCRIFPFDNCYGTNRCTKTVKIEPHSSESRLLKSTSVTTSCYFPEMKWSFTDFSMTLTQIYARCVSLKCQSNNTTSEVSSPHLHCPRQLNPSLPNRLQTLGKPCPSSLFHFFQRYISLTVVNTSTRTNFWNFTQQNLDYTDSENYTSVTWHAFR